MNAHVLLILLNEFGKRDKFKAAEHFISRNEFNKFNNTRARMLDIDIKITLKSYF